MSENISPSMELVNSICARSEQTNEIFAAIFAVRQDMQPIAKDAINDYFKSRYSTLSAVMDSLNPAMAQHQVLPVQSFSYDGKNLVTVITQLIHIPSGQEITFVMRGPAGEAGIQSVGSTVTYLRRYSLVSIFALTSEDDDGNAATGNFNGKKGRGKSQQSEVQMMTTGTWRKANSIIQEYFAGDPVLGLNEINNNKYNYKSYRDLPEFLVQQFIDRANAGKIKKKIPSHLKEIMDYLATRLDGNMDLLLEQVSNFTGREIKKLTDLQANEADDFVLQQIGF